MSLHLRLTPRAALHTRIFGGPSGPAGADGEAVLSGTTVPTVDTGSDGDFYIHTDTYDIYGPRVGGAWGTPTSLIGPQGPAGPPGAGSGDVLGPATNTDNFVPQWNGINSKTLKDGVSLATIARTANNLSDLASAPTARSNLGLVDLIALGADPTGTDDTSTAWAAGVTAGGTVRVPKGTYKLTAQVNVNAAVTFICEPGVLIDVTHDNKAFNVTASNVNFIGLGGGILDGPRSGTTYASGSIGFYFAGANAGSHITRCSVGGFEVRNFKDRAIVPKWVDYGDFSRNYVHDCTYGGIMPLSCLKTTVNYNHVDSIEPGSGGSTPYLNAYGISFTADQVADGACIDFQCIGNTISRVWTWTGIDTHGGYRGTITENTVRDCCIGIGATVLLSTTVPGAINITNNIIDANTMYPSGKVINGGTVFAKSAIIVAGINGGTRSERNIVADNQIYGYGYYINPNYFAPISIQQCGGTTVENNLLHNSRSVVIELAYTNFAVTVRDNLIYEFEPVAAEATYAISLSTTCTGVIAGNQLIRGTGTGAASRFLYNVPVQTGGHVVAAARDSSIHNATKWNGTSSSNVTDIGGAL